MTRKEIDLLSPHSWRRSPKAAPAQVRAPAWRQCDWTEFVPTSASDSPSPATPSSELLHSQQTSATLGISDRSPQSTRNPVSGAAFAVLYNFCDELSGHCEKCILAVMVHVRQ